MLRRTLILALLTAPLPLLAGCNRERATFLDSGTVSHLASLRYPEDAAYGPDLDVVVVGKRDRLYLANRTARSYEQRELWLNRQYVSQIDTVPVGANTSYRLTEFINKHEEPYPVPGFFVPGSAFPVVLAELYDPHTGLRNRLLVQSVEQRQFGVEGQQ